jgi:hypothetical protein
LVADCCCTDIFGLCLKNGINFRQYVQTLAGAGTIVGAVAVPDPYNYEDWLLKDENSTYMTVQSPLCANISPNGLPIGFLRLERTGYYEVNITMRISVDTAATNPVPGSNFIIGAALWNLCNGCRPTNFQTELRTFTNFNAPDGDIAPQDDDTLDIAFTWVLLLDRKGALLRFNIAAWQEANGTLLQTHTLALNSAVVALKYLNDQCEDCAC